MSHQSGGPPGTVFLGEGPNGAFETFSSIEKKTFQRAIEKLVQRVFAAFGSNRENYESEPVYDQLFYTFNES